MMQFKDVHFSYTQNPFIQGLTLSFAEGKITSVIGPNGSGKSTVIKLGSRLLWPKQGSVTLQGQDLSQMKGKAFAKAVSVLLQHQSVPNLTVEELVFSGRYPHQSFFLSRSKKDQIQVESAMELTECVLFREKRLHELSGGERQKVFFAMALAQDTPMIFLDEPTTYLDIHVAHEMMALIQKLKHICKKTIVMVLHDLNLALQYSDQVVIMDKGSIAAKGSPEFLWRQGIMQEVFQVEVKRFHEDGKLFYCPSPIDIK